MIRDGDFDYYTPLTFVAKEIKSSYMFDRRCKRNLELRDQITINREDCRLWV